NWGPDGRFLLVNAEGRLWRVPLERPALDPFDTGFANRCNNDHGFSPDGRWLALSHHTGRGAEIFRMPAEGGVPMAVTHAAPSWFHGWSPDGARITYAAARGGSRRVDIYTAAADGSDERRLTFGSGHADGPDYGADGQWIYYNSDQSGPAQIWRVRPDGSGHQKLFADERVNWFPHPSPDGEWVVYLSYPPGTKGHPADLPVQVCRMRPDGSDRVILAEITGGQGTMNVPSWSPDGKGFAFIAYGHEGL
ncbi:MAG: hypothetical protein ORN49_13035, partial [Rhodobacteraceae bacterium]|nr:hypothetical protein [Paracoccaceae bacterium]